MRLLFLIGLTCTLLTGCTTSSNRTADYPADSGRELKYAGYLTIHENEDFTRVAIRNPWDTTRILQTYLLVPRERALPASLPQGTVVRTPLRNALVYSSIHCSLLHQLGAFEQIGGVCDLNYFRMPEVHQAHAENRLTDAGNSMSPDIEKVIELNPDAILLSPFENSGGYGKIEKLGIPIIECADYMEFSPLARAEWMRFYGLLFGCGAQADSLFRETEKNYLHLAEKAANPSHSPTVISEMKSGAAWYIPGGQSTMGILFRDAGADYFWKEDTHTGSVPLAFEVVFDKAHTADFWLIKYFGERDKTYRDIENEYAPYAQFKAFKERNIYACNTADIPYYEETAFRPDRLLEDMIRIFHPELPGEGSLRYFTPLSE